MNLDTGLIPFTKIKLKPQSGSKSLQNPLSNEGRTGLKIYKEFLKLSNKKATQFKNGQKIIDTSPKKMYTW